MTKLQDAIYYLILHNEYYGKFILNMRRIYTNRISTMSISVTDKINLHINQDFVQSIPFNELVGVLKHECMHIVMGHIDRSKEIGCNEWSAILNYAADCSINQYIPEIKESGHGIFPSSFREAFPDKEILDKETFEYYYQFLKEQQEDMIDELSEQMVDSHEMWKESSETGITKEIIKEALERVADSCSPGNVPGEVTEAILRLSKPTVNWKQQLRRFCHKLININKKQTRNRINRRFGLQNPGRRKRVELNLAVIADTSGSVQMWAINQFFCEMDNIYKYCSNIYFIEADTEVKNVIKYKPGIVKEIHGRGGTLYQPALNQAKELGVDGIIYFGDGDCFDLLQDPKISVLWAMIDGCNPPTENFGNTIHIRQGNASAR